MKSQVLTGKPVVFVTLFLDSSKITEDTLCVLRDPLTRKTMAEWELFILDAQEEWIEFEACRPLRAMAEQSSSQEEDLSSNDDDIDLGVTPKAFMFKKPLKLPVIKIRKDNGPETTPAKDIEELQAAVVDLATLFTRAATDSRDNAQEVLKFVWGAVKEVIKAVNRLNDRVSGTGEKWWEHLRSCRRTTDLRTCAWV